MNLKTLTKNPVVLLRGIIAIIYIVFGVFLFFNLYYLSFVQLKYRPVFAAVIMLYGIYRLYRFIIEAKDLKGEESV